MLFVVLSWLPWLAAGSYLRVADGEDGDRVLEIAVRTFEIPGRPDTRLRLVGVSHVGEADYYAALQELLDEADLVLFEGIGGELPEFREPDVESDVNPQVVLARALGLAYQIHAMDYTRPHFVNSDLTPLELFALLRGEDLDALSAEGRQRLTVLMETMRGGGMGGQVFGTMLTRLSEQPGMRRGLAWVMVEVLGNMRGDPSQYVGVPDDMRELMRVLLTQRNKVVVRDVARLLAKDEPPRELAVFYGAAHMPELENTLAEAHGFKPVDTKWLPAFRGSTRELSLMQQTMLQWLVRQQRDALEMMIPPDAEEE